MKVTYNQIIETFQGFAEAHKQINEFGTGNLWEIVQQDSLLKQFHYPLLFVADSPVSVGDGIITSSFNVLVMDKANEGVVETEVKSDTLQILLDVVSYFEKLYAGDWKYVTIEKSGSIESFTERFDDTLTGWTINISLKQPLDYNECEIPYVGHTPSSPSCAPVTVTEGLTITEIASGGSYTCTPFTSINVSNSNDSYTNDITTDLELPNINLTDSDGTITSVPSMEDLTCTPLTPINVSNFNDSYTVNTLIDLELPNISLTDSDGVVTSIPSMEAVVCTLAAKDIYLKSLFAITNDVMELITIDADNAGTYTSISDDGGSGTITIDINGAGYGAFVNPTVLAVSDYIVIKRTITTAAGYVKLTGTYV